uniref:Reverse transcriptase domain-containing protein n=1 Tax=Wolfiporia cocos TaxID=81056 RepID=A0A7G7YDV9_9APHY|nr:hypothetical protein [Wolfiporia cocos]
MFSLKAQLVNKTESSELSYSRIWIPKPNGKKRALSVPTKAWRMYLYMLNSIMTIWLHPYQSPHQHGFWPGRGPMTAYKDLLSAVNQSENVYEFDLQGCFDQIQIEEAIETIGNTGLPSNWRKQLCDLNRRLPRPGKDYLEPLINWTDEQKAYDVLKYFGLDLTTIKKEDLIMFFALH